jgi:hypothetical protein
MVNPGQDGDFTNDPTQNPDHELARKVDSRHAQVEELRTIKSQGGFTKTKSLSDRNSIKSLEIRHSNQSLHKENESRYIRRGHVDRYRQESGATAYEHGSECSGPNGCAMFAGGDVEAQRDGRNNVGRNLI